MKAAMVAIIVTRENRELSAILRTSVGIEACKFENEIIQRTAQVVANLADYYSDAHRHAYPARLNDNLGMVR